MKIEQVERTRTDCPYIGTKMCDFTGSEGCEACYVLQINDKKGEAKILDSWHVTYGLLPDNIDELHLKDKCWFCKDGVERKKDQYAVIDLAHPEPEHTRGMFFGFGKKVRTPIGSLIQLPVGVCKECRKRFLTRDLLKWGVPILSLIIALLIIILVPGVATVSENLWYIPLLVFAVIAVIGYFAGKISSNIYEKKASVKTSFDPFDLPIISKMHWDGWFPLMTDGKRVRVAFKKEKPKPHLVFKREIVESEDFEV